MKYGNNQKAYLNTVLNYGGKKIVAYQLSKRNDNSLVRATFDPLIGKRIPSITMLHSDRGYQYTSPFFNQ
ncbi:hypothetical protein SAMN05421791_103256 [Facklamia miroungae]|uniref:Integrase catalytic domain-containing protein n=1 Tax=Facklamia miroungae TaxID=120956 RepID=A0A1G7S191_9LACT|nr:DDE-type integrase/transposase/recombinase [Facklamia miroungae]NKZ29200.1 hypothetical protein [Facklamia miroungae]SDG16783.1 hypothetical protein SAMN05421791_103256 [Facklamia miroungae]